MRIKTAWRVDMFRGRGVGEKGSEGGRTGTVGEREGGLEGRPKTLKEMRASRRPLTWRVEMFRGRGWEHEHTQLLSNIPS